MKIANYDTDLTDAQWTFLEPLLPKPHFRGRPPTDRRRINNAIFISSKGAFSGDCSPPLSRPGRESATLRMRVWQNAATYDEAILKGESNDVTIQLGGSPRNAPPIPDPVLLGLQGFTILPEPAPGLLSLFAVGIFLFAARNERPSNKAR